MRIGIDARELAGRPTGVGRYLGELLREWHQRPYANDCEFFLYIPDALPPDPKTDALFGRDLFKISPVAGTPGTWWEQMRLPGAVQADAPDVFFAPAYTQPLRLRVPVVLTIHDISFVVHPEWFGWREGLRRRRLTGLSAAAAHTILTVSEFSRREIADHLSVPASRIRVIEQGVEPRFAGGHDDPREPMVLFVGSILNRRRIPQLIEAFARVARDRSDVRLVIVGENRSYPAQDPAGLARARGIESRVLIESYVPEDRLRDLYGRASVFAFLSEYEGFGLTPLEALSAGVPTVLLDTPQARETFGQAALFVQPDDVDGTAGAIRTLLESPVVRAEILGRVPALLRRYSWDRVAAETFDALRTAAGAGREHS